MAQGFVVPIPQPLYKDDGSGNIVPADGYKVYTYETNSTTPLATYSDGQLASLNTNPIVADPDGRFRIFVGQGVTIKCAITTDADVPVETYDYLEPMIADPSAGSVTAVPTGGTIVWPDPSNLPTGFLLCDGSAVSRATYSALNTVYAACTPAYPFGSGNGTTTFNVPDMRGAFPLAQAASGTGATIGDTGGSLDHTHTGPSHTHTVAVTHTGWGGTQIAGPGTSGTMLASDGVAQNPTQSTGDQTFTTAAGGTGNTGGANPAYVVLGCWVVKT